MSHDEITLGGRVKLDSVRAPSDRPTQPIIHARGQMPNGSPVPDIAPPDRRRALDLARAFLSGGEAQRVVGRDGCEEMARWIDAQPDYVAVIDRVVGAELVAQRIVTGPDVEGDPSLREALAALSDAKHRLALLGSSPSPIGDVVGAVQGLIDEWLLATVAVERVRDRGASPSDEAVERMDNAEGAVAGLSSLDPRFSGWLRRRRAALRGILELAPQVADRGPGMAVPRIWTPRDDGRCAVCGAAEGLHVPMPHRGGHPHCPAAP